MVSPGCADCAVNANECILVALAGILEEIRQANSEYNWDPLTFAFAAVVGVIALCFAALTIGQGPLAAGHGRVKSSAYTIGPWASMNKRNFD